MKGEGMPAVTARAFFRIEGRPGEESNMNAELLGVSFWVAAFGDCAARVRTAWARFKQPLLDVRDTARRDRIGINIEFIGQEATEIRTYPFENVCTNTRVEGSWKLVIP